MTAVPRDSEERKPDRSPGRLVAAAIVGAVAGALVFQFFGNANRGYIDTASLFWWWIYQWINPESETEHGWLILAIAGWLCWKNLANAEGGLRRAECPEPPESRGEGDMAPETKPDAKARYSEIRIPNSAIVALFGGLALHAIGFAAQQARLSIVALLLFTWGVLRLGGGRRWGRAAAFPLAFMLFAVPINVLDSLGFWLRMWVIDASTALAHLAHIGVVQNGTLLLAPDGRYNYDVAAACSGVRSLMALAALSLLVGYLNFRSWWRRALVFLLCFPLVYVGNVARISAIVFAAQTGGPAWGDRAHAVMGYAVFVIVLGGVLAGAALLRRLAPEKCHLMDDTVARDSVGGGRPRDLKVGAAFRRRPKFEPARTHPAFESRDRSSRAVATSIALLVAAVAEMTFLHRLSTRPPGGECGIVLASDGKNPVELPAFLGREWIGWPAAVTAVERQILPPDTGFSRVDYVASRQTQHVFLSIVLSGRDRTSIHRPELCLVGQGWTLADRRAHQFSYPAHPDAGFPATVLRVTREVNTAAGRTVAPQLVAYWFVAGDRVVAGHWSRIAWDAYNRVAHGRVDRWAYILMQTDAADGDTVALARMQAVLNATLPAFQKPFARQ